MLLPYRSQVLLLALRCQTQVPLPASLPDEPAPDEPTWQSLCSDARVLCEPDMLALHLVLNLALLLVWP